MSIIDTRMDAKLRAVMLSEIRAFLPAFLSAASAERRGPIAVASELLKLPEADLRRVVSVHLMLSEPVRDFIDDLPVGVRRPLTSSARPRVAGRVLASGIDWASTARYRSTSSPLGDVWVSRPARRIFDIPENRALAWVLRALENCGVLAVPPNSKGAWVEEIRAMITLVQRVRRNAWMEGVDATWPGDDVFRRLGADRTGFYRVRVANAARHIRRLTYAPTEAEIVDALSERYFEPELDWKLFEIAVLLRLVRALAGVCRWEGSLGMFGKGGRRPVASFRLSEERLVRLWYQRWPPATAPSELAEAARYYELPSADSRPDITVEIIDNGVTTRAVLLELKASGSGSYLSSGFAQLLGYLRDRPGLFGADAAAWLVAPGGSSFVSKPPNGRSLWITSADDVGNALVRDIAA